MADEDKDSRTEAPTAKRLEKERSKGNVPTSQEVQTLSILTGSLIMIWLLVPHLVTRLGEILGGFLGKAHAFPVDAEGVRSTLVGVIVEVAIALAPGGMLLVFAALLGSIGQNGLLFSPSKLEIKWNKVSPIKGVNKVLSKQKVVDLAKGIVKLTLVGTVAYLVVVPNFNAPDMLIQMPLSVALKELHLILVLLLFTIILAYTVMAVADLVWQRHSHTERLKMTKQEVKDEHKQAEGDPMVKGRIRRLRVQRARERMMAAVPSATVVVTNPTHFAVALLYEVDDMAAPKLVAKGVDHMAARIREVATENDVPIIENPPLARALYASVELDQEIPAEHYKAVAEVIGFVMRMSSRKRPPPREDRP